MHNTKHPAIPPTSSQGKDEQATSLSLALSLVFFCSRRQSNLLSPEVPAFHPVQSVLAPLAALGLRLVPLDLELRQSPVDPPGSGKT
eukprot:3042669-Rhodomonas_salina.2